MPGHDYLIVGAAAGCAGWGHRDLLPYFIRSKTSGPRGLGLARRRRPRGEPEGDRKRMWHGVWRKALRCGLAVWAAALVLPAWAEAEAEAGQETVALEIRNAGVGAPLRCTILLAHFVTLEAGQAAPGETLRLSLVRSGGDGVLLFRGDGGKQMAVENILCGVSEDWSRTRSDVPLLDLRDPGRGALQVACSLAGRLRYRASAPSVFEPPVSGRN